jgi:hypothetical protein
MIKFMAWNCTMFSNIFVAEK